MATPGQQTFVQTYWPLAQDIAGATGLDPTVVLGQAAQETGWGQHVSGNNIFGITPGGNLASYPDIPTAAQAYVDLIKSRYAGATQAPDSAAQAQAIASAGYNHDPKYGGLCRAERRDGAGPHQLCAGERSVFGGLQPTACERGCVG
jgi:flagellum-specific peptidoglycan hydrolase FlgJ